MFFSTPEHLPYKPDVKLLTTKQHHLQEPSLVIVDSQSVSTTTGTSEQGS